MKRALLLVAIAACDRGSTTTRGSAAVFATRPAAPRLVEDHRPLDLRGFNVELNPTDAHGETIYADNDGGCHTLLDPKYPAGGEYPGDKPVPCPASMLAAEWGYCTGTDSILTNAKHDECICLPGSGEPRPPPVRIPCPK